MENEIEMNNSINIYVDENGKKYIKRADLQSVYATLYPDLSFSVRGHEGTFYPVTRDLEVILDQEQFSFSEIEISSDDIKDNVASTISGDDFEMTPEAGPENISGDTPDPTPEEGPELDTADQDEVENEPVVRKSDLEYKKLIEEKISKVSEKLAEFKKKNGKDITGHVSTTIQGLELELEELKRISSELGSRSRLNGLSEMNLAILDYKREQNEERRKDYNKQIAELQNLKSQIKRKGIASFVTDKRIKHYENKVKKLQEKDVFMGKVQRRIMYPKYLIENKKRSLLAHAAGRVEDYNNRIHDNELMKNNIDTLFGNSILNGVREKIYDIKGIYFKKRLDRSQAILEEMQEKNHIVTMYGSRVTSLGRERLERIRQANQQQVQMNTGAVATI